MKLDRRLLTLLVLVAIAALPACGSKRGGGGGGGGADCGGCSNSNFLTAQSCTEAGHTWSYESPACNGTCADEDYLGDGFCDDEFNCAEFGYDWGDCPEVDDDDAWGDDDDIAGDDPTPPPPTVPQTVTFTTDDGLTLEGTWQPAPGVDNGPAVLLLHQLGGDRGDFQSVWSGFQDSGIATFAFDFRSHGNSEEAAVPIEDLTTDTTQLPHDVTAALTFLISQPEVDAERVGVMGMSAGANLAVLANHNRADWGVKSSCAISLKLDRVVNFAGTDVLDLTNAQYVAAAENAAESADAEALYGITAKPKDLRLVLQVSSHGVDLLNGSIDAQEGTVAWFVEQL